MPCYYIISFSHQEEEEKAREEREKEAMRVRKLQKFDMMEGGDNEDEAMGGKVNLAYSHPNLDQAGKTNQQDRF